MSDLGKAILAAAKSMVGSRFRLHGRDPATGLDCVGLAVNALQSDETDAICPSGYTLRQKDWRSMLSFAAPLGLRICDGENVEAGDLLLFSVGPAAVHLGISDGRGAIVHAHAGLRKVVFGQPNPEWCLLMHWRMRSAVPENS